MMEFFQSFFEGNANNLVIFPFVWPFTTALLLLLFPASWKARKKVLGIISIGILIVLEVFILSRVWRGEILVSKMSDWPGPWGIILLIDRLSAIMLLLASITAFSALFYSAFDDNLVEGGNHPLFPALYQFLLVGINMSFLTADLFNLFVCYELMLAASYCLLILGGKKEQLSAGFHYVSLNLFNSTLFLVALGLLYGAMGTLNMADLSQKIAALSLDRRALIDAISMVFLIVFGMKAALVPLYFWLPDTYPTPSTATATLFAGIMTKVGVYSILRIFTLVFGGPDSYAANWLLPMATVTMFVGVLGAICQMNFRRLLSFHIISQVGYMMMGIGFFTPLGIAGGVSYIIHHIMVKSGLFLCSGLARFSTGSEDLRDMGGLTKFPIFATLFFIAGVSLAGFPPFSGFFSKFLVIRAGFEAKEYLVVAVSLVAGLLTLLSMMKIWTMAFWGKAEKDRVVDRRFMPAPLLLATFLLVSFSITLAIFCEPLYQLVQSTAHQVLDSSLYIEAVLPAEARL